MQNIAHKSAQLLPLPARVAFDFKWLGGKRPTLKVNLRPAINRMPATAKTVLHWRALRREPWGIHGRSVPSAGTGAG